MSNPPNNPMIYHITHVENLASILAEDVIWSDAERLARNLGNLRVGMTAIKERRLLSLEVKCHPGTKVGDYVPFYFCPRSIMLFLLYKGNHPNLDYKGGQSPILHLQASFQNAVTWAGLNGRQWAFSDRNAGTVYADFFNNPTQLTEIDWNAVHAQDFRKETIKEGKQAEFLMHKSFPWSLIQNVGVHDARVEAQVQSILQNAHHKPLVSVEKNWYY